ncbi:alpha/beta hydrolase [Pseudomonas sp. NW5]|uniref:alpha/beta hydrolase n=1 Tax=Pseudomonas sp. NW5 TaxID=2934934 RepID=UPI002021C207|nr:alpha/beta hydrolase [Pseudomonas sp. NW5]MCL7463251.1 alpha/beta hydrolase [Pseudomonas sp. NW5]
MPTPTPPPRRRLLRWLGLGALGSATAGLLQACSPLGLINALVPSGSHQRRRDIAYGPHPRQRLDLYQPLEPLPGRPLVVFFYGGSWNSGRKEDYLFAGEALAARGVSVAIADYRLNPEVTWPGFLEDCAQAVHWAHQRRAELGAEALYLMGHSAGAYNAAMLALDPRWLAPFALTPDILQGWIGLAGPYDFLPIGIPEVQAAFNWPDTPADSQPLFHARHGVAAPGQRVLLLAAENDPLVDPQRNTLGLAAALRAQAVLVETQLFSRVSHATLIGALAQPLRPLAPVLPRVVEFLGEGVG